MNVNAVLVSAYALATQERYDEAERLLQSCSDAENSALGQDLVARIRHCQGRDSEARNIWQNILNDDPTNIKSREAISALDANLKNNGKCIFKILVYVCAALLLSIAFWWMVPNHETSQTPVLTEPLYVYVTNEVERIVVQEVVKTVPEVIERVETNVVERVVEIMVPVETVVTVAVERVVCVTNEVRETVETEMSFVDDVVKNESPPHPTALVYCPEYIVKPGDQVGRLAQKYKFRVRDFEMINPGVDSNLIIPGQRVKLPGFIHEEDLIE